MLDSYLINITLVDTYCNNSVACLEKLVMSSDFDVVRDAFIAVKDDFKQKIAEHFNDDAYVKAISKGDFDLNGLNEVLEALFTHDEASLFDMFELISYPSKKSHNLRLDVSITPIRVFAPSEATGIVAALTTAQYAKICVLNTENPDDGFVFTHSRPDYTKCRLWI